MGDGDILQIPNLESLPERPRAGSLRSWGIISRPFIIYFTMLERQTGARLSRLIPILSLQLLRQMITILLRNIYRGPGRHGLAHVSVDGWMMKLSRWGVLIYGWDAWGSTPNVNKSPVRGNRKSVRSMNTINNSAEEVWILDRVGEIAAWNPRPVPSWPMFV